MTQDTAAIPAKPAGQLAKVALIDYLMFTLPHLNMAVTQAIESENVNNADLGQLVRAFTYAKTRLEPYRSPEMKKEDFPHTELLDLHHLIYTHLTKHTDMEKYPQVASLLDNISKKAAVYISASPQALTP